MFFSYELLNPRDGSLSLIWQLGNLDNDAKWRDVAQKSDLIHARVMDFCTEIAKRLPVSQGSHDDAHRSHFSLRLIGILFSGLVKCHCLKMEFALQEVRALKLWHQRRPKLDCPRIDLPSGLGHRDQISFEVGQNASTLGQLDQLEEGWADQIDPDTMVARFQSDKAAITMNELEGSSCRLAEEDLGNDFGLPLGISPMDWGEEVAEFCNAGPPKKRSAEPMSPVTLFDADISHNVDQSMGLSERPVSEIQAFPPSPETAAFERATVNGQEEPIMVEPRPLSDSPSMSPLRSLEPGETIRAPTKPKIRRLKIDAKTQMDKETLTQNRDTCANLMCTDPFSLPLGLKQPLFESTARRFLADKFWNQQLLASAHAPGISPDLEAQQLEVTEGDLQVPMCEEGEEFTEGVPINHPPTVGDLNAPDDLALGIPPRTDALEAGHFEISIERDGTRNASNMNEQSRLSELRNSNLLANPVSEFEGDPNIEFDQPAEELVEQDGSSHLHTINERSELASIPIRASTMEFPRSSAGSSTSGNSLNCQELPTEGQLLEEISKQARGRGPVLFDDLVSGLTHKREVAKCFANLLGLASKGSVDTEQAQSFGAITIWRC